MLENTSQNHATDPQGDAPNLADIAAEAEQEAADVVAIVKALSESCSEDNSMQRCLQGIARLMTPICEKLNTLAWDLPRSDQRAQPSVEEGQR